MTTASDAGRTAPGELLLPVAGGAVYRDETVFDVFAEVVAAVPGSGGGGWQVCVADDGGLTWTRDYLTEVAMVGHAADPDGVAGSVVEAVTRAMTVSRPAGTGSAGHG